jgi:hypothetical protein
MRALEHIVVDQQVIAQKGRLVLHVAEQAANERRHCIHQSRILAIGAKGPRRFFLMDTTPHLNDD